MAVAVWGPRADNPWLSTLFDAVEAELGQPVPPPGMPGPFSLDGLDKLSAVLGSAGLADVDVETHPVPYVERDFDSIWDKTAALAGPLAKLLTSIPPEKATGIRRRYAEALEEFETPDGYEIPGVSLIGSATRAA